LVVFLPYPSAIFEGIETTDLLICEVRPDHSSFGLPLGILLLFYISLNRVHMTFAKLSALSDYAYQLRRDKCNSLAFLSACSIGDNPIILLELTTTNREMIHF
jgi:hypothetical protein